MIELLITCFPLLIRIAYLRLRKREISVYAVHRAVFIWMMLFFTLIFTIEYYHPDTGNALIPFRVVPVVAERGGTVTEIYVVAGQHVDPGDELFAVDDSSERAQVAEAKARISEVQAQVIAAQSEIPSAQDEVTEAQADLESAQLTLTNLERLGKENSPAYAEDNYLRAKDRFDASTAKVNEAQQNVASLQIQLNDVLPAQLSAAQASLEAAQVGLDKTRITSEVAGRIDQLTLNVGDRAGQFALSPAMVIVPDITPANPLEIVGGFSQTNQAVLHVGMTAEVACKTNINNAMTDSVFPARITRIQNEIATGQVGPTGTLLQPSQRPGTGDLVVYASLVYPEHEKMLVEGSRCILQAYTTHIGGSLQGTFWGDLIEAWAIEKAVVMRMKVWLMLFVGTGLAGG
ncbi:MAG: hypothetical protein CML66_21760 [Rhodobacteraceae bacterium]|nr:hypothetical protein [Paracoccaceae bacterium]QEW20476.1 Inner membrane protein YibH [Marinibacterium anthonyi]